MGNSLHARETFPGPDVGLDYWISWLDLEFLKQAHILKGTEGTFHCMVPCAPTCYWYMSGFSFSFLFFLVGVGEGVPLEPELGGLIHERQVVCHWTTSTLSSTPSATNESINQPRKPNKPHLPWRVCWPRSILKCLQPCSPEGIGDFYCSFLRGEKCTQDFSPNVLLIHSHRSRAVLNWDFVNLVFGWLWAVFVLSECFWRLCQ